jgi:fumarate hydratase class II
MPGKVNPVMVEMLQQVSAQVIGNDTAITHGGIQGAFELNVAIPLLARNVLQSLNFLTNAVRTFAVNCVDGIIANVERCEANAEASLSTATALNSYIGYDEGTAIVLEAHKSGRTIREVARERGVTEQVLDEALDMRAMTTNQPS